MAKGVVSRGAVPARHGEHEVGSGAKVGDAAVLRIVDDESDEIGTVLVAEGVRLVHDAIGLASQLTQGRAEGIGGGFGVRSVGRVDQVELSVDAACSVGSVGFTDGKILFR